MDILNQMPPFWRVFTVATVACVIVSALPLFFISTLLVWTIVAIAGWKYPQLLAGKVQGMSSPTGYAVGMGALMGASVNLAVVLVMIVWTLIWGSVVAGALAHAHQDMRGLQTATESIYAGMMGVTWLIAGFFAPFVGAALGAFGGLIGGSQIPKA
ncbi:MAG: hypothetical protein HKL92_00445 [Candidatus Eremiobacteraeota bacterium]|nr:hypothetical protein [Candidatus Eremiobacteraeota bacterium]